MGEHPENNQGQQMRVRRGVKMHGGRVQRGKREEEAEEAKDRGACQIK